MIRFFTVILFTVTILPVFGGAQAERWEFWDESNEASRAAIDHSRWQNILDDYRYINSKDNTARFSYRKAEDTGLQQIDEYIDSLEKIAIRNYSRTEQFAFWVNLYNAATVRLILENYPVESIRKISDPWGTKLLTVEGQEISLDDIEHRILRPIWKDPRIHFIVNCASVGCPDLSSRALTAENTEGILEQAASAYINHPRGASVVNNTLVLSSIFNWYQSDFGDDEQQMLSYLDNYRDMNSLIAQSGRTREKIRIKYDYNWSLNE